MFKEESGYFLCLDNKYQKQRRKENEPWHWSYIKLIRFKLNRALKALSLRSWSTRFQFESYFIFIIFKSQKQFISAKKTTFTYSICAFHIMPLFLLSDLTESKSKQAFSCLRVACLFICLFLNLHLPDRNLLFSCVSGFWIHLSGQFASSPMRQSWTQDSIDLVAFSLHFLHFQMCIYLIW